MVREFPSNKDWLHMLKEGKRYERKNHIWFEFFWTSFIAFSFPLCFGLIFVDITGYAKGYSYDLGPEKDISVMIGCIELVIWLVLSLPSNIYVFNKTKKKGKLYLLIPIILYIALAVLSIYILWGGWYVYLKEVFNI